MKRNEWEQMVAQELEIEIAPDIEKLLPVQSTWRSREISLEKWRPSFHPFIHHRMGTGHFASPFFDHRVLGTRDREVCMLFGYQYNWTDEKTKAWEEFGFQVVKNRIPVFIDGMDLFASMLVEVWAKGVVVPSVRLPIKPPSSKAADH